MAATADSRITNRICSEMMVMEMNGVMMEGLLLIKARRRWPATILADRRTARVKGRIRFLSVSIRTMNGIRKGGVS